jgi:23S rRNA (guanine745-N1)-methyltransferase
MVSPRQASSITAARAARRAGNNDGMLDDVIRYLACPYCGAGLARGDGCLRCRSGHAFDIARQGYVTLLPAGAKGGRGDTAAMVRARDDFLAAGHFASLASDLAKAAADVAPPGAAPGCVADMGAGTGYHLAAVLDRLPGRAGLALDISKFAVRRAARAHQRIGAVACDAWLRLPVADSAAAVVLNVFAPRNGAELRRVLNPAGALIVVTPQADHLAELTRPLGLLAVDERKDERLTATLGPYFELASRPGHRALLSLDRRAVGALVAMGPSAWHAEPAALAARIGQLPEPVSVTLAVTVSVFRPLALAGAAGG